ncbi:MAG: carbohydrate ABC transporter permease [Chloroflexota bacterium]
MKPRSLRENINLWSMIIVFVLFAVSPFACMIITSFKHSADLYNKDNNPFLYNELPPLPQRDGDDLIRPNPTLEHVILLMEDTPYLVFIRNSLVVGVLVVLVTLALSIPAAYALARLTGRWGERAGILVFLVYLVPPTLLFIPMFRIVVQLGLRNSIWALVLTYPTITVPFCMWLLMGFFKSIPRDLEEAAMVDGYSRFEGFLRVIMPLSMPGIIAVVVFTFTLTLHEFIYALAFVSSSSQRTISVGVPTELIRGDVFFWQSLLAAAVIVALPVGFVYNLFLNNLVQGFTMGAVKG